MKENSFYAVIDNFLSEEEHAEVWKYCQYDDYSFINSRNWKKAWKLTDGSPLHGTLLFSNVVAAKVVGERYNIPEDMRKVTPFNNIVDTFISRVLGTPEVHQVIGRLDEGWSGLAFVPYIYPRETGLSWHQENGIYAGSYIYYASPEWRADWGGELLIAEHEGGIDLCQDYRVPSGEVVPLMNHLDSSREDEVLLKSGRGVYVCPKPNRLVVLRGGIAHKVNKVNVNSAPRVSCTGFFVKGNDNKESGI
ncbi:2OG-Fe(II) oxygenase [Pseudomonas aeruginosa]|uniref:2OG-Fe(II) oxygenase n=1 Tax=Pseudomonas aeruginosa TaxID=287 RepID=UPI00404688E8